MRRNAKSANATTTLTPTTIKRAALAALCALAACAEPVEYEAQAQPTRSASLFATEPDLQWRLPERLHEVSGLAVSPDGRLFAHDDEQAVIYEIDMQSGAFVKAFALGDPVMAGDFEGIAVTPDGQFWMTTSRGELYRFAEGGDGAHVAYQRFDTGLANVCEVEGLAYAPAEESLILACKRNHAENMRDTVSLYAWAEGPGTRQFRTMPEAPIAAAAGERRFRPSSIDFDARSGRIIMLSAADAIVAEVAPDGALLAARELEGQHKQPEGVAIMPDGALIVADEGGEDGRALISRYPRIP